jgi:hypothetical protein
VSDIEETDEAPVKNKGGRPRGSRSQSRSVALIERLVSANRNEIKAILKKAIELADAQEP